MRVVAGSRGGRRLSAPPGHGTRPTSDRVREAVFSSLGDRVPRAHVLDLYAGTGALGIEALSRGAATATFVEEDRRTTEVIRRNLAELDLRDRAVVVRGSCATFCRAPAGGPFGLVLMDPPYAVALRDLLGLLRALHAAGALAAQTRVVVERSRRDPALAGSGEPGIDLPGFLAFDRARSYGDTVIVQLTAAGEKADS